MSALLEDLREWASAGQTIESALRRGRMDFKKVAGLAGLAFAASILALNLMRAVSGRPLGDASTAAIVAYFAEHSLIPRLASWIAPLPVVSLPVFAAGVAAATRSARGFSGWGLAGVAGAAMTNAIFVGVFATDAALGARAADLASDTQYLQVLWDLNTALFPLSVAGSSLTMFCLGMAVLSSGLAPRLGRWALVGAAFLFAAAVQAQPALAGSRSPFIALPGVVVWLVFLVVVSVRLLRGTFERGERP